MNTIHRIVELMPFIILVGAVILILFFMGHGKCTVWMPRCAVRMSRYVVRMSRSLPWTVGGGFNHRIGNPNKHEYIPSNYYPNAVITLAEAIILIIISYEI